MDTALAVAIVSTTIAILGVGALWINTMGQRINDAKAEARMLAKRVDKLEDEIRSLRLDKRN